MPEYHLTGPTPEPGAVTLTQAHFGVNVVTTYDQEIALPDAGLADLVAELGASTLRFPGGSATEHYFDMTNPNSTVPAVAGAEALTPMDAFFTAAGQIGADVALVVPTRVGFADSAIAALRAGQYGERDTLAPEYLADVESFLRAAFAEAAQNGVAITVLEIGNEFWGSGEMTAGEYGFLAGRVAVLLEQVLQDLGLDETVRIAAQSTAAASDIYAPRNDVQNFIDTAPDGTETLRSQAYINKHFGGVTPAHYEPVTIPGQGSAAGQLNTMIDRINAVPGAADALDGVILHMYQRGGLEGVDDGRNYVFEQLANFEDRLNRAPGAEAMSYHITEWNTATGNRPDNAGLRHASMIVEQMYEMVTHDVTHAQIWPLTFNNAQGTSMVDLGDDRLSIAGTMFSLMQQSLPGLTPMLDWEAPGQIDIHGFEGDARAVLFVSERSGAAQQDVQLHIGAVIDTAKYVVAFTELWDGGAGGASADAAPQIRYENAYTGFIDRLDFDLNDWANARIELTQVGWTDDIVVTYGAHDRIFTYAGDDVVDSGGGGDHIHTGRGNDEIRAGRGNDTLIGGPDDDLLHGGPGKDTFVFRTGDGHDRLSDVDFGVDLFRINGEIAHSYSTLRAIDGVTLEVVGGHVVIGYGAGDTIMLTNTRPIEATGGRQIGTGSADMMIGSDAQDDLRGHNGPDMLIDGAGRDFLRGGNGADLFVLVRDGEQDVITDLQVHCDRIDLTAWEIAHFEQLQIGVAHDADGAWQGHGFIRYADEELRLDGMDAAMLPFLNEDVILI